MTTLKTFVGNCELLSGYVSQSERHCVGCPAKYLGGAGKVLPLILSKINIGYCKAINIGYCKAINTNNFKIVILLIEIQHKMCVYIFLELVS